MQTILDTVICSMVCPECKKEFDITVRWLYSPPNKCPHCNVDMTPDDSIEKQRERKT